MVFICDRCGGNLLFEEGDTYCTCDHCQVKQTLPRISSKEKANLYERAYRARIRNEFDNALNIYEKILSDDRTDPEIYWQIVLCRYGIEYVKDKLSGNNKPTIRRMQVTPITSDVDYKEALYYANDVQKQVYENKAQTIYDIQKKILDISSKEEPYDVFISYKETDNDGNRTEDSVLGQKLYNMLTKEGLKVFFSRISLESVYGENYEPYIFAALNSAKVMLLIGTKSEYFNATWVKNEWSRFALMMEKNPDKKLIPIYKDSNDIPEKLSLQQGQDIKKLGWDDDILRFFQKRIEDNKKQFAEKETVVVKQGYVDKKNVLKLGKVALEDGEFEKATGYFEDVLRVDAENAEAYFGEWLAEYGFKNAEQAADSPDYYGNPEGERIEAFAADQTIIEKAVKDYIVYGFLEEVDIRKVFAFDRCIFSGVSFRKKLKDDIFFHILKNKKLERARQLADGELKVSIEDMVSYIESKLDEGIREAEEKDEQKKTAKKEEYAKFLIEAENKAKVLYEDAIKRREEQYSYLISRYKRTRKKQELISLEKEFNALYGYKNSAKYEKKCRSKRTRLIVRNIILIYFFITLIPHAIALYILIFSVLVPLSQSKEYYKNAMKLKEEGQYEEAIKELESIPWDDYKDSEEEIKEISNTIKQNQYDEAIRLKDSGRYEEAQKIFTLLGEYHDSSQQIYNCTQAIKENKYNEAIKLYHEDGDFAAAYKQFLDLSGYKDSKSMALEIVESYPNVILAAAEKGDTVVFGNYNGNTEWIVVEKREDKTLIVSKYAVEERIYDDVFDMHVNWEKSKLKNWLNTTYYDSAFSKEEQNMIKDAIIKYDNGEEYVYHIFLLSVNELNSFADTKEKRKVTLADGTPVAYWLRGGLRDGEAPYVDDAGSIYENYWTDVYGVRPALWIDNSKLQ